MRVRFPPPAPQLGALRCFLLSRVDPLASAPLPTVRPLNNPRRSLPPRIGTRRTPRLRVRPDVLVPNDRRIPCEFPERPRGGNSDAMRRIRYAVVPPSLRHPPKAPHTPLPIDGSEPRIDDLPGPISTSLRVVPGSAVQCPTEQVSHSRTHSSATTPSAVHSVLTVWR